jgi:TetR/AcrR family transcriptional regulator, cholesterol catabolism regulator
VVDGLLDAAAAQVREAGYPGLTIRLVAKRAGVSSGTAYNYFSSKEHLVASLFLRWLADLPQRAADPADPAPLRVSQVLQSIADLAGPSPNSGPPTGPRCWPKTRTPAEFGTPSALT